MLFEHTRVLEIGTTVILGVAMFWNMGLFDKYNGWLYKLRIWVVAGLFLLSFHDYSLIYLLIGMLSFYKHGRSKKTHTLDSE